VATLISDYSCSQAILGPLTSEFDTQEIDLCHRHANDLTVPAGWSLERRSIPELAWLETLADEVRQIGKPADLSLSSATVSPNPNGVVELGRKGHLRVIADATPPR